jgi:hypothetical protein
MDYNFDTSFDRRDNVTDFNEEGFLSTKAGELSANCKIQFSEWFSLCKEITRFCFDICKRVSPQSDKRQEWLAVALFIKALSLFEGSYILFENCMSIESAVMIRSLMDAVFALGAITRHPEVAQEYWDDNLARKIEAISKLLKYETKAKQPNAADYARTLNELMVKKGNRTLKQLSTNYLAKQAGREDFYCTAYTVFSWQVHSNIMDIASFLHGNSDSEIKAVILDPSTHDFNKLFLTAAESIVFALEEFNSLFSLQQEVQIAEYKKEYQGIYFKYKQQDDAPIAPI